MSGVDKGVQACVTDKLQRKVIFILCRGHSFSLVIKYVCDISTELISLFNLVQGLYNYFTASAKRYHVLQEKLEASQFDQLVKTLVDSRWVKNGNFYL